MPRRPRSILGGYVYHVHNKGNGGTKLFNTPADYTLFENVLAEAFESVPLRILGYTVMRDQWHFLVWPKQGKDDQVSDFFRRPTTAHSLRWRASHGTLGFGHVYQGRFKSFPVQADKHLLSVLRFIERKAQREKLVRSADQWRWGSLYRRLHGTAEERSLLADSPVPLGRKWLEQVHKPQPAAELVAIGQCLLRGQPYGDPAWQQIATRRMGLESTLRPRGRPRKIDV